LEKSSRAYAIFFDTLSPFQYIQSPFQYFWCFTPSVGVPMDLLIAENDFAVVGVLKPRFKAEDNAVVLARNTEQSMSMQRGREYHAAIVDLDLPSTEGLALMRQITPMNGSVQKSAG
jgi:hypothetical protein